MLKSKSARSAAFYLFVFLILFGHTIAWRMSAEDITITVTGKETSTVDGEKIFDVYTADEEFTVIDAWSFLSGDSAKRYNKLIVGQVCDVTRAGWRRPWLILDSKPSIMKVKQCTPAK